VPGEKFIVTEGVTMVFITDNVIVFELTVVTVAQAALEVSVTDTTSPFANELVTKLAAFEPVLMPFTFH
jgi:hypothetical protein